MQWLALSVTKSMWPNTITPAPVILLRGANESEDGRPTPWSASHIDGVVEEGLLRSPILMPGLPILGSREELDPFISADAKDAVSSGLGNIERAVVA